MRSLITLCLVSTLALAGCEHCPPPGHETECPGGMPMNSDGKCPREQVGTEKKVA